MIILIRLSQIVSDHLQTICQKRRRTRSRWRRPSPPHCSLEEEPHRHSSPSFIAEATSSGGIPLIEFRRGLPPGWETLAAAPPERARSMRAMPLLVRLGMDKVRVLQRTECEQQSAVELPDQNPHRWSLSGWTRVPCAGRTPLASVCTVVEIAAASELVHHEVSCVQGTWLELDVPHDSPRGKQQHLSIADAESDDYSFGDTGVVRITRVAFFRATDVESPPRKEADRLQEQPRDGRLAHDVLNMARQQSRGPIPALLILEEGFQRLCEELLVCLATAGAHWRLDGQPLARTSATDTTKNSSCKHRTCSRHATASRGQYRPTGRSQKIVTETEKKNFFCRWHSGKQRAARPYHLWPDSGTLRDAGQGRE